MYIVPTGGTRFIKYNFQALNHISEPPIQYPLIAPTYPIDPATPFKCITPCERFSKCLPQGECEFQIE